MVVQESSSYWEQAWRQRSLASAAWGLAAPQPQRQGMFLNGSWSDMMVGVVRLWMPIFRRPWTTCWNLPLQLAGDHTTEVCFGPCAVSLAGSWCVLVGVVWCAVGERVEQGVNCCPRMGREQKRTRLNRVCHSLYSGKHQANSDHV